MNRLHPFGIMLGSMALGAGLVNFGIYLGHATAPQPKPTMVKVVHLCDRPSEDSSTNGCLTSAHADYHDGAWWVTVK